MPEPFRFSSGHVAYTVADLIGVCNQSPQEIIYHLKSGDFEKWLAYIGEGEIAQKVEELRKILVIEEEQLKQFIQVLQPPETSAIEEPETEQSLETSAIKEPETEQSLETSAIEEPETEQSLETSAIEEPETEQSLETSETSEVTEETKESKKPIAPLNESSDESIEANSSFAKAVQGFMSNYINKE